jgi:hypothetical protein
MARVQHLPLYLSSYQFSKEIYRLKLKLPKTLKHDLGQEAFSSVLKILKCVVLANKAQDKSRHISRLLLETEVQWVFLRLLFDLRGITEGEFKVLSERLSDIEKQSQAWLKWQQGGKPKTGTASSQGKGQKTSWQPPEKGIT